MRFGVIYRLSIKNTKYFLYGSTILSVSKRKATYLQYLRNNKYSNKLLQNLYNKYGENSLIFTIVQENIPENILGDIESIFIGNNCSRIEDNNGGMNMRDGKRIRFSLKVKEKMSLSQKGSKKPWNSHPLSKETKEKMRIAKIGFKHTKETLEKMNKDRIGKKMKPHNRPNNGIKILQFDKNMNFIKEWDKILCVENQLNILSTSIINSLNGRSKTAGGFIWKYKIKNNVN